MKLSHYCLNESICFEDHTLVQLVIEDPALLGEMVSELHSQIHGSDGRFALFDDKFVKIDLSKNVNMVINPFEIDLNKNTILSGLYSEIDDILKNEYNYQETTKELNELQCRISSVADDIECDLMSEDVSLKMIMKAMQLKFINPEPISEKILRFTHLSDKYEKYKLMVFVNVASFISKSDYEELLSNLEYLHSPILMVESRTAGNPLKRLIIDSDKCEINQQECMIINNDPILRF